MLKLMRLSMLVATLGVAFVILAAPAKSADADEGFKLPWKAGVAHKVLQGWGGSYSHSGAQMFYAYDFDLAEGEPVLASKGGTVTDATGGFTACGGSALANSANRVTIQHNDGTSSLYLHFSRVDVSKNQSVSQGQQLGLSGKSGWTNCVPHLHFQRQAQGIWITNSRTVYFDEYPGQQLSTNSTYVSQNGSSTTYVKPAITSPSPGSTLSGGSVTFSWSTGTGVTQYFLYVGKSLGANDIFGNTVSCCSQSVSSIPTDGSTIWIRMWSNFPTGWQYNDYSYKAASASVTYVKAGITSPSPGSMLPGSSATFAWSTGTGVTQYFLYVGRSQGANDIFGSSVACCSRSVSNIPSDGSTIWVRMWSYFPSAGWQYNDYSYRAASASGDRLLAGQQRAPGQSITSANGCFRLIYQTDGNFVLYRMNGYQAIWASNTVGSARNAIMQTDGNLVVYNAGGSAVWASNTAGNSGSWLIMQNDGNAVIYRPNGGSAIWATNTVRAC